jgi:hypothetical protein
MHLTHNNAIIKEALAILVVVRKAFQMFDVIHDSIEKGSFASVRWGKMAPKALFLMMSSQNLTVFGAKVGHRPY